MVPLYTNLLRWRIPDFDVRQLLEANVPAGLHRHLGGLKVDVAPQDLDGEDFCKPVRDAGDGVTLDVKLQED